MGEPATPFEQLLGVFPKQSSHAIPVIYRQLMCSPQSEIIDFYPTDFKLDINGARYAWMGVNLLPFIDRQRLVDAMKRVEAEGQLSEGEKERNKRGSNLIFMHNEGDGAILQFFSKNDPTKENFELMASYKRLDKISGKIKGYRHGKKLNMDIQLPYLNLQLQTIMNN